MTAIKPSSGQGRPTPTLDLQELIARSAARKPFRNRPLGYLLGLVFVVWAVVAAVVAIMLVFDTPGASKNVHAIGFVAAVFIAPAFPLYYFARKLTVRNASEVIRRDQRAPVLYLREFRTDTDALLKRWGGLFVAVFSLKQAPEASDEDRVVRLLRRLGPVIAIGRPGEVMSTLGAARVYVTDDEWQDVVVQVSARAGLTVIRLGETPGLRWEVEHAARNLPPGRVLFYVPRNEQGERQLCYDGFRHQAGQVVPRPLPPMAGSPRFIRFDDSWRACFMADDAALLFDARPPVFLVAAGAGSDRQQVRDSTALARVFSVLGPVIALLPEGHEPPKKNAAWMVVDDNDIVEIIGKDTWRDTPVVVTASADHRFGDLLQRLTETIDPRRLVVHIPKGAGLTAIRDEMARALPGIALPRRGHFVIFDRSWRPIVLRRSWFARLPWPRFMREMPLSAGRIRAPDLQPFFDRYASRAPGKKLAVWARAVFGVVVLITVVGLVARDPKSVVPSLESSPPIESGWLGLNWGLSGAQVRTFFPRLSLDADEPAGTEEPVNVSVDRSVSVGGIELPMRLVFLRNRLVGAFFVRQASEEEYSAVRAGLVDLYGEPEIGPGSAIWRRSPVEIIVVYAALDKKNGAPKSIVLRFYNRSFEEKPPPPD